MIKQNIEKLKTSEYVETTCDKCETTFLRTIKNIKQSRKERKSNFDYCQSCSNKISIHKKPQCSKIFWNEEKKKEHGEDVKTTLYYDGISKRDTSGDKNSMWGKTHSIKSIEKMSQSRRGKIGINSTAWKGGKSSLVRRIKGFQNVNGWYKNVYKRDGYKCAKCNSKNKIEAHHIKPIKNIVDEAKLIIEEENLYLYLINLDIIKDIDLKNGITLCRSCHKKEHTNYGSHNPKVKKIS